MRKGLALWMICFSLVLTRLVGLHLHVCEGVEVDARFNGTTHYADNGFLFGDHHAQDDGDDREIQPLALVASKVPVDLPDLVALLPGASGQASGTERRLPLQAPRGPPLTIGSQPPHFTPPPCGPPTTLA